MQDLLVKNLGIVDYVTTWEKMKNFVAMRSLNTTDELWLLQHHPVYTLGYQGDRSHIINVNNNVPIVHTDRGGNITYHGPGQLVGYMLMDIRRKSISVHELVKTTEATIIEVLKSYSLHGHTIKNSPGIYIDNKKICSLGFRIKNGYSYHGFAMNINMDLSVFKHINPCGLTNMQIIQLSDFTEDADINEVSKNITKRISTNFNYTN